MSETALPRRRRLAAGARRIAPFLGGVLAALVALALFSALVHGPAPLTSSDVSQVVASALASHTPAPARAQLVYAAIQPSLVLIKTEDAAVKDHAGDGLGSGVIVNALGDIMTSLHVVADATTIEVTFADGTNSKAEVTLREPDNDIAVIRATQLPKVVVPAILGNPGAVQVGSEAYVVGNPFGLYSSISAGVVSGLGRSFDDPNSERVLHGLIQVDAAVNPGNSGGPLLNRDGQVIGIVAALVNPTKQAVFVGIGLAVPIDVAGGAAGLPQY
jgi:S1-C subfamily serine protease